ncbi:MAG: hypothetical protein JWQ65_1114 [Devosia sp.]|nr:hypothetical protein [Devosia sp.]
MALAVAKLARGSLISSSETWKYVRGTPSTGKDFATWSAGTNEKKALKDFGALLGSAVSKDTYRYVVWQNYLPGWWRGRVEDVHDLVIPEIGWEYLTY